jgi:hypothetical protein
MRKFRFAGTNFGSFQRTALFPPSFTPANRRTLFLRGHTWILPRTHIGRQLRPVGNY